MSSTLIVGNAPAGDSKQVLELIAAAKAVNSTQITVVMAGAPRLTVPDLPVNTICKIENAQLGESDSATFDAATNALTAYAKELQPDLVLFSKSDASSVIAPRLAIRLGAAYAGECTGIESSSGSWTITRPVYGGNANARFRTSTDQPLVAMLRSGSYEATALGDSSPEVISFDATPHIGDSRSTLIRTVQEAHEGVRLEDAEVVVSGGRGLGGAEPFKQIEELADLLGGAVGASRAACDAGWIDHSHQVGLTGKSVSPRLYLTFGISGASQHMAGCSSARNIVAVNTDPEASIFSDARFGVVGDWNKVLPALISAVRDIS